MVEDEAGWGSGDFFVNGIVCMLRFYLIGKGKWKKEDIDKKYTCIWKRIVLAWVFSKVWDYRQGDQLMDDCYFVSDRARFKSRWPGFRVRALNQNLISLSCTEFRNGGSGGRLLAFKTLLWPSGVVGLLADHLISLCLSFSSAKWENTNKAPTLFVCVFED